MLLLGSGYKHSVCIVAAFLCRLFFLAHCYYFDTVLLYLNINVICHTEELKQCDVLCKSDIHYTWGFFFISIIVISYRHFQ